MALLPCYAIIAPLWHHFLVMPSLPLMASLRPYIIITPMASLLHSSTTWNKSLSLTIIHSFTLPASTCRVMYPQSEIYDTQSTVDGAIQSTEQTNRPSLPRFIISRELSTLPDTTVHLLQSKLHNLSKSAVWTVGTFDTAAAVTTTCTATPAPVIITTTPTQWRDDCPIHCTFLVRLEIVARRPSQHQGRKEELCPPQQRDSKDAAAKRHDYSQVHLRCEEWK